MSAPFAAAPSTSRGRLLLFLGPCLAVVGIIGYIVQLGLRRLAAPWYMPGLATLAAGLVAYSLWQRRTVWRVLVLTALVLVAGAEWAFMYAMRLPAYTGPIAAGKPFPTFATFRADGAPFTQRDLEGNQVTVLVFFRGRW
jgi:hypothetical protein